MPTLISDALAWNATYAPAKTAVVSQTGRLTFQDLWARSTRLADALARLGVQPWFR